MLRPAPKKGTTGPALLICGDDEFSIKQRAREVYDQWCSELGGMDHEIIDASAANTDEALRKLARLMEALNTLPFFGGGKAVWFKECNFLGEERTATSSAVTQFLSSLADTLKQFNWQSVRLVVSAGKADKRRTLYKTFEKIGSIESFTALSADDKDWANRAESEAIRLLKEFGKEISDDALAELVTRVGPNLRSLASEIDKLSLFAGERPSITLEDVRTITSRQKLAQAFALGEALGERDLGKLMRVLDQELWEIRTGADKKKSEIGLLYGLISKVRSLLMLKEFRQRGWLKAARDYNAFKSQLERIPLTDLPPDRRFNPLSGHPFVLYQAFRQCENYELDELIRAMSILLDANISLVSRGLDEAMVLQQSLVEIVGIKSRRKPERAH
jgi:DNA polymerase-3 subunit delta